MARKVLILVLMEYKNTIIMKDFVSTNSFVLILVLMEYKNTIMNEMERERQEVLILVLMEYKNTTQVYLRTSKAQKS